MNEYAVAWQLAAEAYLELAFRTEVDAGAVLAAANRIEEALSTDPYSIGESRDERRRIVFDAPLVVGVEIIEETRTVHIHTARRYGK